MLTEAGGHLSSLLRTELALAKAELSQNATRLGTGAAMLVAGALLALVALNVLASSLVAWIASTGVAPGLSALIVGGGFLFAALGFFLSGKRRLSAKNLRPSRLAKNLRRDVATIKEATHV
ncbi:phage holin family protein [Thalassococcus arenae]|uniref:phage holin family protein n=1 Tax=Thalassococcus arenae TaxID=2851652 RepID=UPI0020CB483F|nr:phage holin family protein [Thalassococcus arenae]